MNLQRFFGQAWKHRGAISRVSLLGYAALILVFLLQVMIARLLGLQQYGVYATCLAVIALAEVPVVVRSGEIAMRAMRPGPDGLAPNYPALARLLAQRDLRPFIVACLVIVAAGFAFGPAFNLDPVLLATLALSIPAQISYGAYKSLYFVHKEMPALGRVELGYAAFQIVASLLGFLLGGVYGIAAAVPLAALVKTLRARAGSRRFARESPSAPAAGRLDVTRDGIYSIVRNGLSSGLAQFDVIMLGQMQPPEAVALYKVGKSLTSLPIKLAFPLWRMTQPRVMTAINAGDRHAERRIVLTGSLAFVLLMLALLPLVLPFGADLIAFAYGEQYRDAFRYFLILMVGAWLFNGVTGWFAFWCVLSRSQGYGILVFAIALVILLVAGLSWGVASAGHMAVVASSALAVASGLAFLGLYLRPRARREY